MKKSYGLTVCIPRMECGRLVYEAKCVIRYSISIEAQLGRRRVGVDGHIPGDGHIPEPPYVSTVNFNRSLVRRPGKILVYR